MDKSFKTQKVNVYTFAKPHDKPNVVSRALVSAPLTYENAVNRKSKTMGHDKTDIHQHDILNFCGHVVLKVKFYTLY